MMHVSYCLLRGIQVETISLYVTEKGESLAKVFRWLDHLWTLLNLHICTEDF